MNSQNIEIIEWLESVPVWHMVRRASGFSCFVKGFLVCIRLTSCLAHSWFTFRLNTTIHIYFCNVPGLFFQYWCWVLYQILYLPLSYLCVNVIRINAHRIHTYILLMPPTALKKLEVTRFHCLKSPGWKPSWGRFCQAVLNPWQSNVMSDT